MAKPSEQPAAMNAAERKRLGRSKRKETPRSSHGDWAAAADRPDPLALLQAQDEGRLQELLPIKYGRMMESPFAFLRGSAVVMASDLASTPVSGLDVVLCGDAHLSNFGIFATPERDLVFDVNDFDEAYPGPWEWDLKRLATSAVVAGRDNGFDDKTCRQLVRVTARAYRRAMREFAAMSIMDRWYAHVDASAVVELFAEHDADDAKRARKTVKKARTRTSTHSLMKLTEEVDGRRQFKNDPPLLVRLAELATAAEKEAAKAQGDVPKYWEAYVSSLPEERRALLRRFRITDLALRVGGVGSVGTRCTIALLEGDRPGDAMILQQKEAGHSSLEAYLPKQAYPDQAERIVIGQRIMQASSDIFLGHNHSSRGTQYYWRQFKDMKGSFDLSRYGPKGVGVYLVACAICLARGHARSGDAIAISSYMGKGKTFDKAIGRFAVAYADRTEKDYQALLDAIEEGRIVAQPGI